MPSGIITALEIQKGNKERVSIYLDGEYAFSLDIIRAAALRTGQALSEAEVAALRDEDAVGQAVDRAVRFLAYRPRSEHEVRRNLAEKDVLPPVIDAAVRRLQALGYLDDRAFAAFWIENRSTFKPLSPRALRYELRQKGVDAALIDELLADMDAHDAAYRAAHKRLSRLRGSDPHTFRSKISAFLQGRGFSYATIRQVTEQLLTEIETQDEDYFQVPSDEE
jgi:regulatory protein